MLSYTKVALAMVSTTLIFHTFWVFLAFWRYRNNLIARQIFEIVHPFAKYATFSGYLISNFWVSLYSLSASLTFVFCFNIING